MPHKRVAAVADVFISGQEARKLDCTGARLCTHSVLGPTEGPKDMSCGGGAWDRRRRERECSSAHVPGEE